MAEHLRVRTCLARNVIGSSTIKKFTSLRTLKRLLSITQDFVTLKCFSDTALDMKSFSYRPFSPTSQVSDGVSHHSVKMVNYTSEILSTLRFRAKSVASRCASSTKSLGTTDLPAMNTKARETTVIQVLQRHESGFGRIRSLVLAVKPRFKKDQIVFI